MVFKVPLAVFLVLLSNYNFAAAHENRRMPVKEMYIQDHTSFYQNRFKRENPALGHRSYVRAVQPNVVVMPSVPNNAYGGVPSSYGVNRAPNVVVSMPNDAYTPVVANPYAVPTRY